MEQREKRLRLDRVSYTKINAALQIRTDRQKNKRIKCSFSGSLVMVGEDIEKKRNTSYIFHYHYGVKKFFGRFNLKRTG